MCVVCIEAFDCDNSTHGEKGEDEREGNAEKVTEARGRGLAGLCRSALYVLGYLRPR